MTEQEAIDAMALTEYPASKKDGDTENAHEKADEILLEFLRTNGYGPVADAFEKASGSHGGFWYA